MQRALLVALAVWLVGINLTAFFAYGRDKRLARQGRFRIPEARLLTFALLGGALGALAGMRCFHHKTKKWKFRLLVPLLLALQLGLIGWLAWKICQNAQVWFT